MNSRPILLVEDNNDDAFFMQRALQAAGIGNEVTRAGDGEAAIEFFSRPEASDLMKRPCLTLLDLKLPYKSGFDVLKWIRESHDFRTMAVIVLTTSGEPSDVLRALELGANAYVVKPQALGDLTHLAAAIRDFWLKYHRPAA